MNDKAPLTCYACNKPATTKEHAPPSSFFPQNHRTNLITVPSCPEHNVDNSKDVEYARNVITTMFGVNEVGERHFADKTQRSLDHSPALLKRTFADMHAIQFQGKTTGAFTVDNKRIEQVMIACVCALNFRETGEKQPNWEIVLPNLFFKENATEEDKETWLQFLSALSLLPYAVRPTDAPDVFEYAVAEIPGGRFYSMRFYKGFQVFAFAATQGK